MYTSRPTQLSNYMVTGFDRARKVWVFLAGAATQQRAERLVSESRFGRLKPRKVVTREQVQSYLDQLRLTNRSK